MRHIALAQLVVMVRISMYSLCIMRIKFSVRGSCRNDSDVQHAEMSSGDSSPKYGLDDDASMRCVHDADEHEVKN